MGFKTMEDEIQNQTIIEDIEEMVAEPVKKDYLLPASILLSAIIIAGAWVYTTGRKGSDIPRTAAIVANTEQAQRSVLEEAVLPSGGVVLPVRWGDLGIQLTSAGVIDREKLEALYTGRGGGLTEEMRNLLERGDNGNITITESNSGFLLNLLWALGLGTKNDILSMGEMADPWYGGAGNFASTGGWTIARGDPMSHYGRHPFVVLTPGEQEMVDRVSRNIYRPCCGNSVHFPDCNHGMAMLGLLELMASQGVSEDEMYKVALHVNAYWFPDTYLTIAQYLASRGTDWSGIDPREILGANYSSASGYQRILSQVTAPAKPSGGGCGV